MTIVIFIIWQGIRFSCELQKLWGDWLWEMHHLDLLNISHWLRVSYPTRSGCNEKSDRITHAYLIMVIKGEFTSSITLYNWVYDHSIRKRLFTSWSWIRYPYEFQKLWGKWLWTGLRIAILCYTNCIFHFIGEVGAELQVSNLGSFSWEYRYLR